MAAAGGRLDVIKFLQPLFGARVHNKTRNSYTILHWAVQGGHYEVARYSIESLKMNPQHRDKVCMWGGGGGETCSNSVGCLEQSYCIVVTDVGKRLVICTVCVVFGSLITDCIQRVSIFAFIVFTQQRIARATNNRPGSRSYMRKSLL